MRHFPVFIDTKDQTVLVAGAGETAIAKLRLLLKTQAHLRVVAPEAEPQVQAWADEGRLELILSPFVPSDLTGARMAYAATNNEPLDRRIIAAARNAGVLANHVDNLDGSDFITAAMVDRDPVTIAIGTEGTAPVLARRIKADLEKALDPQLGTLAREAAAFRAKAEELPAGAPRRAFWQRFFDVTGPRALKTAAAIGGTASRRLLAALEQGFADAQASASSGEGELAIIGTGTGDPELLTLKARKRLHDADVVFAPAGLSLQILELVRREAVIRSDAQTDAILRTAATQKTVVLRTGDGADDTAHALRAAAATAGQPAEFIPGIADTAGSVSSSSPLNAFYGASHGEEKSAAHSLLQ